MLVQDLAKALNAIHNLSLAGICKRQPDERAGEGCGRPLTVRQLACKVTRIKIVNPACLCCQLLAIAHLMVNTGRPSSMVDSHMRMPWKEIVSASILTIHCWLSRLCDKPASLQTACPLARAVGTAKVKDGTSTAHDIPGRTTTFC